MKTVHISILIVGVIIAIVASFSLGFYNGASNASLLLAYTAANSNIKTYNTLKDNSVKQAAEIQKAELEMNIQTLEDLKNHKETIFVAPSRIFTFFRLFSTEGIDINSVILEYKNLVPMKKTSTEQ